MHDIICNARCTGFATHQPNKKKQNQDTKLVTSGLPTFFSPPSPSFFLVLSCLTHALFPSRGSPAGIPLLGFSSLGFFPSRSYLRFSLPKGNRNETFGHLFFLLSTTNLKSFCFTQEGFCLFFSFFLFPQSHR